MANALFLVAADQFHLVPSGKDGVDFSYLEALQHSISHRRSTTTRRSGLRSGLHPNVPRGPFRAVMTTASASAVATSSIITGHAASWVGDPRRRAAAGKTSFASAAISWPRRGRAAYVDDFQKSENYLPLAKPGRQYPFSVTPLFSLRPDPGGADRGSVDPDFLFSLRHHLHTLRLPSFQSICFRYAVTIVAAMVCGLGGFARPAMAVVDTWIFDGDGNWDEGGKWSLRHPGSGQCQRRNRRWRYRRHGRRVGQVALDRWIVVGQQQGGRAL